MSERGDMVLVADVHLGRDDPDLEPFCAFLRARARDTAVMVLLGDVFSLWLGREKFTESHHRAVLDACRELRRAGVRVVFIEGNREFATARWRGDAFDEVDEARAEAPWAGRTWYLAHGDLLNREDRRGLLFRSLIRSRPVVGAFGLLPARTGLALAARIERSLRSRNLRHKTSIRRARFDRYAAWLAARGYDGGVIGHLHVELELELPCPGAAPRRLYVLPDWRTGRRVLRIPAQGEPRFESPGPARPNPPAVIEVRERAGRAELTLERAVAAAPGTRVAVSSGHGPEVRRGLLVSCDPAARHAVVRLEPGPPIQAGDRLLGVDDA